MNKTNYNYDREADVLYISFTHSQQVFTVELSDYLILRLDLGKENGGIPHAVGITILFPAELLKQGHNPLALQLDRLHRFSAEVKSAVLEVLSKPPVSEILAARLEFTSAAPRLPELLAA